MSALIDEFEASGLHVTARIEGELTALPAAVDLAGYRLVQEALTNAHKHGSVPRAHVWIDREESELRLVVTNPTSNDAGPNSPVVDATAGHGLLGIRERVAGVGGTISTGRDGGTFRVEALIPLAADVPQVPA